MRDNVLAMQALVGLQATVSLVLTPIEDATLGVWIAATAARRVDWKGAMLTYGRACCFRERCAGLQMVRLAGGSCRRTQSWLLTTSCLTCPRGSSSCAARWTFLPVQSRQDRQRLPMLCEKHAVL
jgi:hypothetical protein